jgi:hypothetical protein
VHGIEILFLLEEALAMFRVTIDHQTKKLGVGKQARGEAKPRKSPYVHLSIERKNFFTPDGATRAAGIVIRALLFPSFLFRCRAC